MSIQDIWQQLPPAVLRGKYFIDHAELLFQDKACSRIIHITQSDTVLVITIDEVCRLFFTPLSDGGYAYDGWEIGDYT